MKKVTNDFMSRKSSLLFIPPFWEIIILGCIVCLDMILFPNDCNAQWKKIFDFGSNINTIYFKEFTSTPSDGFVSLWVNNQSRPDKLWRTGDGGLSWKQITYPQSASNIFVQPSSFTFKDSSEGWWSTFLNSGTVVSSDVFHTLDGGDVWILTPAQHMIGKVFYVPSTNRLLITDDPCAYSLDNGNSFIKFNIPIASTNGIAFSDDIHGVMSGFIGKIIYTTDGGLSWSYSNYQAEQYQPVGISGTLTFFAISEGLNTSGTIVRSDDGGATWNIAYNYFDNTRNSVTGTMQNNLYTLFFQTTKDNSEGIMISQDTGKTFQSICGPSNFIDTRFYVRDSFIYAGDKYGGLWLNTTGIGSNSTPQLSLSKISSSVLSNCQKFDTSLTFTFFDSCNGIQAKLVSTFVSGSNNFSFSSPSAIPRTIHPDDSLIISYNPLTSQPDTAQLHLRFHLGWTDFDTTVSLFGAGRIVKENVRFIPSLSQNAAEAGQSVVLSVTPDRVLSGRGLKSVSFDLSYIGDLLNFEGTASPDPSIQVTIGTVTHAGKIETLPVTITGTDISLDSLKALAMIKYTAMLTDTVFTEITMTNLKLNGGDPDYKNCILSADNSNTDFTLHFVCGDTSVYNFLRTGKMLDIISVRPNPTQAEIELDLHSAHKQDVTIEILNALGVKVYSQRESIVIGANKIHVDTKTLSAGMYIVRVGDASQSFVKVE